MNRFLMGVVLVMGMAAQAIAADDPFLDQPHFNWKNLRLTDAIKEVRGNGARTIAVFTDPNCGYCRKYEQSLEQVDNVTVYRFLMPLDTQSVGRSVAVWCSGKDNAGRLQLLQTAMHDRHAVLPVTDCSNPIAANMRFGKKYDITLTPTTIGSDGRLVQGYLPLTNLEQWLSGKGAFDKPTR